MHAYDSYHSVYLPGALRCLHVLIYSLYLCTQDGATLGTLAQLTLSLCDHEFLAVYYFLFHVESFHLLRAVMLFLLLWSLFVFVLLHWLL